METCVEVASLGLFSKFMWRVCGRAVSPWFAFGQASCPSRMPRGKAEALINNIKANFIHRKDNSQYIIQLIASYSLNSHFYIGKKKQKFHF